jgi:hypothetical protein
MARMLPAQRVTERIKHGWPAGVHRQLQVINDGAHRRSSAASVSRIHKAPNDICDLPAAEAY